MAAGGQTKIIKKLQTALTCEGEIVLIATSQFYSLDKHKYVTKYHIKRQVFEPDSDRKSTVVELFSSCSQLEITFFLRDYLYTVRGQEIPTDNPIWEARKARYFEERD